MSIDLRTEQLIRFAGVPRLPNLPLRRKGSRLHLATVHRWRNPGVRGIRLEAICCGGVWCTSVEALQRFFERLAGAREQSPLPEPECLGRDLAGVDRKLDAARIK
jgi:Protein of unknown function (DUF1580)